MSARLGGLGILLLVAVIVGGALAALILWGWPLLVDIATVFGFLVAIFVGGAEWTG